MMNFLAKIMSYALLELSARQSVIHQFGDLDQRIDKAVDESCAVIRFPS